MNSTISTMIIRPQIVRPWSRQYLEVQFFSMNLDLREGRGVSFGSAVRRRLDAFAGSQPVRAATRSPGTARFPRTVIASGDLCAEINFSSSSAALRTLMISCGVAVLCTTRFPSEAIFSLCGINVFQKSLICSFKGQKQGEIDERISSKCDII